MWIAILSLLGAGGLTAASLLVPGVGAIVIPAVTAVLRCKPCLLVLAGLALWVWGDIHGHRKADAVCAANDTAMQQKAVNRDASIDTDTAKYTADQLKQLAADNAALNKQVQDGKKALDVVKNGGCVLGDDAAGRLRNILGPR